MSAASLPTDSLHFFFTIRTKARFIRSQPLSVRVQGFSVTFRSQEQYRQYTISFDSGQTFFTRLNASPNDRHRAVRRAPQESCRNAQSLLVTRESVSQDGPQCEYIYPSDASPTSVSSSPSSSVSSSGSLVSAISARQSASSSIVTVSTSPVR